MKYKNVNVFIIAALAMGYMLVMSFIKNPPNSIKFRNEPVEVLSPGIVYLNHEIKHVAENTGLSEEQRNVLDSFTRQYIENPVGSPAQLVNLGRKINEFSELIQSDGLNNDGYITPVVFDEIQTWRNVSRELCKYKN